MDRRTILWTSLAAIGFLICSSCFRLFEYLPEPEGAQGRWVDPYPAGYLGDPIATADIPGLCESFGAAASRVILDGSLMEMEPPVGDESAYRADCSFGDQDQRSVDGTWAMLSQIKPGDPEPDLTDCDDAGIEAGLGFDEIPICSQMRPARHLGADWAVYWWQRQTTYILAVNEPAEDADLDAFVSDVMAVIEQT